MAGFEAPNDNQRKDAPFLTWRLPAEFSVQAMLTNVVSVNLHRRHLVTSQRAIVAAKLLPIYEEQAAERQKKSGGDKKSSKKLVPANLPEPIKGDARDKAGAALNVSGKVVDMAAKVLTKAIPEIVAAVTSGELAASAAGNCRACFV